MLDSKTPASTRRAQCGRCLRPARACICHWIQPTPNEVDVLILQHPQEVGQAKGSAKLLQLSLAHCEMLAGETLDSQWLHDCLHRPTRDGRAAVPVLLYPDTPSAPAPHNTAMASTPLAALRLVVMDGTWRKSLKMLHLNPALQRLPRLALRETGPSRYLIRKAHKPDQLSTLEATCAALAQLEGHADRYAPLLTAFDEMVRAQLACMKRAS